MKLINRFVRKTPKPSAESSHSRNIPMDSPTYRERMAYLSHLFQGQLLDRLGTDPKDELDPGHPGEIAYAAKLMEETGVKEDEVSEWLQLESITNRIDWYVGALLEATQWDKRLAEVPVRVTDTQKINITTHHDGDRLGITVDRGFIAFLDYLLRLVHIETFRPAQTEFLSDPPGRDDVLRLIRKTGSCYHSGTWSKGMRPISRMHFKKYINPNLTAARIGALLFLIAHEYAHIVLKHHDLGEMEDVINALNSTLMPIRMGQEIQADSYAMDLVLSAIKNLFPAEIDRCHLEIGIFLFLYSLNLAEWGILFELGNDYERFKSAYIVSHSTGVNRANALMEDYGSRLAPQTVLLAEQYLVTIDSIAKDLQHMEGSFGRSK